MQRSSLVFDTADLPDKEAARSISVVFDTRHLPDAEEGSHVGASVSGVTPMQNSPEVAEDPIASWPSNVIQDSSDRFRFDDTSRLLLDLQNQFLVEA